MAKEQKRGNREIKKPKQKKSPLKPESIPGSRSEPPAKSSSIGRTKGNTGGH